jgi:two-component system, OmpR family, alkaline phosphatase synthesis response regulator PhoP
VDAARILLVEDSPSVSLLVQTILEREGFLVELAADGLTAKERLRRSPPDLVLLDVMLPHLSGFELLEMMRAKPAWKSTPVILLTARSSQKDVVHGLDGGANDYITKPFDVEELLARIRRHLR